MHSESFVGPEHSTAQEPTVSAGSAIPVNFSKEYEIAID